MASPLTFTGGLFDRAYKMRKDPQALRAAWTDPTCRVVVSWSDQHLLTASGEALRLPVTHPALTDAARLFLGIDQTSGPVYAVHLPSAPGATLEDAPDPAQFGDGAQWQTLRTVGLLAPAMDAGLAATAQGMFGWHRRHAFCGVCGHPTQSQEGGHLRLCTNSACATPQFPRTDPAVIMLVHNDKDEILLSRQAAWPQGMMSILAGFVEPGETLEQAVAREVMEETQVCVENVVYMSSQPWPFPGSLMLGFMARATSLDITVDTDELESARWVGREEIRTFRDSSLAPGEGPALPSPISISRFLINHWLTHPDTL